MRDIEPSQHARDMLQEREIPEEWMWRVIYILYHLNKLGQVCW